MGKFGTYSNIVEGVREYFSETAGEVFCGYAKDGHTTIILQSYRNDDGEWETNEMYCIDTEEASLLAEVLMSAIK